MNLSTPEAQDLVASLRSQYPNAAFGPAALANLTAGELKALRKHRRLLRRTVLQLAVAHPDRLDAGARAIEIVLGMICLDRAVSQSQCPCGQGAKVLPGDQPSERFPGRQNFTASLPGDEHAHPEPRSTAC